MLIGAAVTSTWWHYAILFVAVAASWAGIPFVGATAAAAAGLAASQGNLDLATVIIVATLAAELGGLVGYSIGFRWGRELLNHPGKHQASRQKLIAQGERAYAKWGRLAVFFTPAIVSGTAKMQHRQFAVWNLIASFGFALSATASAYGLGRLATGHHAARDLGILILGVGVGALLTATFVRHHRRAAANHDLS
jgi:membrane protein DedA with SNARE-associated domain